MNSFSDDGHRLPILLAFTAVPTASAEPAHGYGDPVQAVFFCKRKKPFTCLCHVRADGTCHPAGHSRILRLHLLQLLSVHCLHCPQQRTQQLPFISRRPSEPLVVVALCINTTVTLPVRSSPVVLNTTNGTAFSPYFQIQKYLSGLQHKRKHPPEKGIAISVERSKRTSISLLT